MFAAVVGATLDSGVETVLSDVGGRRSGVRPSASSAATSAAMFDSGAADGAAGAERSADDGRNSGGMASAGSAAIIAARPTDGMGEDEEGGDGATFEVVAAGAAVDVSATMGGTVCIASAAESAESMGGREASREAEGGGGHALLMATNAGRMIAEDDGMGCKVDATSTVEGEVVGFTDGGRTDSETTALRIEAGVSGAAAVGTSVTTVVTVAVTVNIMGTKGVIDLDGASSAEIEDEVVDWAESETKFMLSMRARLSRAANAYTNR